jgi:ABC-type oligopeptide transport system substrate-binding subunit/class 3 adenylate cyclase/ribosomal protein L40E
MNCMKCGYENDDDAEFCEKCGSALARVCSQCNNPLKPGASFCKKCGTPVPLQHPSAGEKERLAALQQAAPSDLKEKIRSSSAQVEGERKPVTILFTDIVGSTSLAEKLDPEEWKEIVSGAHQRVSQMVYKYEGTIAQLLGDGVLAFFGAPITHEDDPIRAVRAALDIQQAIGQYAYELKGYIDNFQLRIGLNTGTVVVGSVGSDLHMEYLAIGDAVNLAARLQSAAQPGRVLISKSTARHVKATFELQDMGEISLKGKTELVAAFEVIKSKAAPGSGRGFEELSSPLVGRGCELAGLREALEALVKGHGQIVTIIGEAGIGKSRLVEEARREGPGSQREAHWIEGRALSYGQTLSFWSINQLIYNDLGLSDGDPEVRVRAALKRRLNALFGEKDIELLPYLAQLLGIRLEGELAERVRRLDGETLKRQTLVSICQYFQRLAEKQPTVAVFEDLHWADSSSLEALEALLAVTDRAPLMLVLLARLEREHGSWRIKVRAETDFSHRYSEILLKPLSPQEQNRLVDNLLAIADLPDPVRRLILERAEGNPFYLEEILRSLIDQGAILREGENWRATRDLTDITIPETLEGVLLARIDRLQEDVRRTLQMASVIGKSFLYRLLEAISIAEQQLDQHLAQLQRADLVREKTILPELEYMFKHSLTQEAAYNSLLLERRKEFHRRVGEALEQLFTERKEQYLGLLAHHFEAAGEHAKAVSYLMQAGDRARLTDEHSEAIGYYQRAVELLEDLQDETRLAQVWLKLGLIYHANFQFEAAHQANEKAFALQQKTLPQKGPAQAAKPRLLRFGFSGSHVSLDPGRAGWGQDFGVICHLFSGLAEINQELDVIPAVASSWQVLDEGRRYIFHLRNDVAWTDGKPVTARDFEWAWKRNLDPALHSGTAPFLYDVTGARDYHQGKNQDPDCVGVRALDAYTLEVRLVEPVAYFPFIVTLAVTYPLPRAAIESFGETWWQPGQIVSNGAYCLVEFDPQHGGRMQRNPGYYGAFPGNVEQVEWTVVRDDTELYKAYLENRLDLAFLGTEKVPDNIPREELYKTQALGVFFLVFPSVTPPFNDVRVRKAFACSLNRQEFFDQFGLPIARGGLVPSGMPGHSPDIGLPFDVDLARRLMVEAGYPEGKGFPAVKGLVPRSPTARLAELTRQWRESLGVDISFEEVDPGELTEWKKEHNTNTLVLNGWLADYPDPDNFLRQSDALSQLHRLGWQDAAYDRLVEEASRIPDRAKRMAMYRQADRLFVAEQTLVLPLFYFLNIELVKPWVKKQPINLLGYVAFQKIIIDEH